MSPSPGPHARLERTSFALACVLLLVLIVVRFAEPIKDGDLFWHLAYARQILERHTLMPDAAIYSWTPASTAMIYCAWLSELALYGLWWLGGEIAMFALRYAAIGVIVGLLWHHSRRFGHARSVWTPLSILVVVLASAPVTPTKPELVSVLFTHVLLWLFYGARQADRNATGQADAVGALQGAGRRAARWLWAVPALMLVWVNSHGGFILAAPLMAAMLVGDLVNRRWAPSLAMSAPARHSMWLAWIAATVATLLTPYGWAYPRQLVADYVFGATTRPDAGWNSAHQDLFSAGGWLLHLPEYGALMLALLAWLAWRARRAGRPLDAVSALLVLAALPLYVAYLRSSYLLPAVFGYIVMAMWPSSVGATSGAPAPGGSARRTRASRRQDGAAIRAQRSAWIPSGRSIASIAVLALAGAVVARTGWEARCRPEAFSWSGFGISHINPVEEAEWLAQHRLGERLYNIFDSGGYLLWRLYPSYRVMVDSRSYPYLAWFDDQYGFSMGERFDSFLHQYPADVAVIDLAKAPAWRNFLRSRQWRLLFVGATAAIFVRIDDARAQDIRYQPAPGLESIKNAAVALRVFDFAVDAGDWITAWRLADRLQGPLACQVSLPVLTAVEDHRLAYQLARTGRYREATERLDRALARKHPGERDQAMLIMLHALAVLGDPASPQAVQVRAGLEALLAPVGAP